MQPASLRRRKRFPSSYEKGGLEKRTRSGSRRPSPQKYPIGHHGANPILLDETRTHEADTEALCRNAAKKQGGDQRRLPPPACEKAHRWHIAMSELASCVHVSGSAPAATTRTRARSSSTPSRASGRTRSSWAPRCDAENAPTCRRRAAGFPGSELRGKTPDR